MTDNEIIKALECCNKPLGENSCTECAFYHSGRCSHNMLKAALDLINRQKAEIEKLKQENDFFRKTITENAQRALEVTVEAIETAKSEAIKECVERLKKRFYLSAARCVMEVYHIDDIVKEMMEVQK